LLSGALTFGGGGGIFSFSVGFGDSVPFTFLAVRGFVLSVNSAGDSLLNRLFDLFSRSERAAFSSSFLRSGTGFLIGFDKIGLSRFLDFSSSSFSRKSIDKGLSLSLSESDGKSNAPAPEDIN
jgi:hypothetical protein